MSNPHVLAAPAPNADLVAAPASQPPWAAELAAHRRQIVDRPRALDRAMEAFAAVGVSPSVRGPVVESPVAEVGTFTYFALRRVRVAARDGGTVRAIVFAGYKAALRRPPGAAPRVGVGGPRQNVCLYDLRYRPVPNARVGGKIMDVRKGTTVRLGLALDLAVERVAKGVDRPHPGLRLPAFWAGFRPDDLPEAEDCPALRRRALAATRPGGDGPPLPSLRALGGEVTAVEREAEGGVAIGFGGKPDNPADVQVLPRSAVLRPYVRPGTVLAPGAPLGDFLPRRVYPNLAKVAEVYGQDVAAWLLQDAAAAGDEERDGLVLRRVELCPGQLGRAVRVYEDVRGLLAPDGTVVPQVFAARTPDALAFERDGVEADLFGLRPEWARPFSPPAPKGAGPRKEAGGGEEEGRGG